MYSLLRDAVHRFSVLCLLLGDISRLNKLVKNVIDSYNTYAFHVAYHEINNFCSVELSKLYVDITKDRVYTDATNGKGRRAAQTTMYIILSALTRLLAPIITFTADEAWQMMPHASSDDKRNVLLNDMPVYTEAYAYDEIENRYNALFELRDDIMKYLEEARAAKTIGKSLDAKVEITVSDKEKFELLSSFGEELETVFIVSSATVNEGADEIKVSPADGCKCVRCWKFSENGKDTEGGFLCVRCSDILGI